MSYLEQLSTKGGKRDTNWKERSQKSLFADDVIVYLTYLKNSSREILNLINNFSYMVGYKMNSNKSVAFLYSKDKQAKEEIKKMTHFIIVTKQNTFV